MNNFTNVNKSTSRVLRGGSWAHAALFVRVAARYRGTPTLTYGGGFRRVRAVSP